MARLTRLDVLIELGRTRGMSASRCGLLGSGAVFHSRYSNIMSSDCLCCGLQLEFSA
jgi:hypothetical protein